MDGGDDVGHVDALGDEARFAADHGVIDFARFFVARVGGFDQLAPKLSFELSDRFLLHTCSSSEHYFVTRGVLKPF